jgi:hypothetical protein
MVTAAKPMVTVVALPQQAKGIVLIPIFLLLSLLGVLAVIVFSFA